MTGGAANSHTVVTADAEGRTLLVLGGGRPVGTFLRAHPAAATRLLVAYPQTDAYRTEEIRHGLRERGRTARPLAAPHAYYAAREHL